MSAYHYFATKVLIFLLSLAVRSVSRTGSVATGPMVCLAGRIKHRTHPLAKTKAKRELKSRGYPQRRWPIFCPAWVLPFTGCEFLRSNPTQPHPFSTQLWLGKKSFLLSTTSVFLNILKSCLIAKKMSSNIFFGDFYYENHRRLFIFHLQNYIIN